MPPDTYLDNITAREIMNPGVVTIVEDASLKQAFNAMAAHGVHAVLVLGREQGKPLGWVTGRGLLSRLEDDPALTQVRDAITERPVSVDPSATARECLGTLTQAGISHLMVGRADDLLPEGVLSEFDLVRLAGR